MSTLSGHGKVYVQRFNQAVNGIPLGLGFAVKRFIQAFAVKTCGLGNFCNAVVLGQVTQRINKKLGVAVVKAFKQVSVYFCLGFHVVEGVKGFCFHDLFLKVAQYLFSLGNVGLLLFFTAFNAAVKQQYKGGSAWQWL